MYAAVVTPYEDDADVDVFFHNTGGYNPMCEQGILAITKVILESGIVKKPSLTFNTPAGRTYARATVEGGEVRQASFRNVASFVYLREQRVLVPDLCQVSFDVAFGGAIYAIVDAESLQICLSTSDFKKIVSYGQRIKKAILQHLKTQDLREPSLNSLFGVLFTAPAPDASNHTRLVNVFGDGIVGRSATGTGVSAFAALQFAKGPLEMNETVTVESILAMTMTVRVVDQTTSGNDKAVVPEVGGTSHIMSRSEFYFDPRDPFKDGFMLD
jgi:proline racemase